MHCNCKVFFIWLGGYGILGHIPLFLFSPNLFSLVNVSSPHYISIGIRFFLTRFL